MCWCWGWSCRPLHRFGIEPGGVSGCAGIAPEAVDAPWPNTYGIWADELKAVGLEQLLEHRWHDTVSYFGEGGSTAQDQSHAHGIDYGLFDRAALQGYWLSGPTVWPGIKTRPNGWW